MDASIVSINVELIALLLVVIGGGWAFYSKISEISMTIGKRAAEIDSLDERTTANEQGLKDTASDLQSEIRDNAKEYRDWQTKISEHFAKFNQHFAVSEERQRTFDKRLESQCEDIKEIKRAVTGWNKDK